MPTSVDELTVADSPQAWSALGFAVDDDTCVVGEVRIRLAGADAGHGLQRLVAARGREHRAGRAGDDAVRSSAAR